MCARVEREKDYGLVYYRIDARYELCWHDNCSVSTAPLNISFGPARPGSNKHIWRHTHFYFLFCLVLLVTDLWFDSIAIDVLCIHVDVHRGPTYPNGRKSIHGGGGGGSDCRRGGNVEKIYPVAFWNVFSSCFLFSPYCILFLSFGFFFFGFYFILFCDEGPSRCVWHFHWKLPV